MAKNRDYTGLVRTPPSMAWLIRKRSILQGELDRAKKDLDRLPQTICQLEQKLAALDQHVFPMHEVPVDPKSIKGTREIAKAVLPYGVMTKHILECLRLADGQRMYTTEIALYVARQAGLDVQEHGRAAFAEKVKWRLKNMLRRGVVARHHNTAMGASVEGQWTLQIDDEDEPPVRLRA